MFKVGDIVMLKSGGPRMTVCGLPRESMPRYFCEWFNEDNKLESGNFPQQALIDAAEQRFVI